MPKTSKETKRWKYTSELFFDDVLPNHIILFLYYHIHICMKSYLCEFLTTFSPPLQIYYISETSSCNSSGNFFKTINTFEFFFQHSFQKLHKRSFSEICPRKSSNIHLSFRKSSNNSFGNSFKGSKVQKFPQIFFMDFLRKS